MGRIDAFDESEKLNIEFYMRKKVGSVYELSYLLVDIQAILGTFLYVLDSEESSLTVSKSMYLPTTSRSFTKKYADFMMLNDFKSGSIILNITSSVIAGLILEFLKRSIWGNNNSEAPITSTITNNNNIIVVNDNSPITRRIDIDERTGVRNISPSDYINSLLSRVQIVEGDHEYNVRKLLDVLIDQGIVTPNIVYNERGIVSLSRDIKRFEGHFLDTYI